MFWKCSSPWWSCYGCDVIHCSRFFQNWRSHGLITIAKSRKLASQHRQQCYCLSRHVLAVPSFSTQGIIIASIKLSDFRLLPSMNRRLLIKRSDLWSKSEGVIELTKALSFKNGLRSSQDLSTKSLAAAFSLLFCWHATLAMVWALKPKVFPQKKSSSKALANGKCGAWNDGGENKYKWHFCLNASYDWASIVFHCLCHPF